MGGNLFKVGRVEKDRYFEIVRSLKPHLDKHFDTNYRIPTAYGNKKDYGDVDILLDAGYIRNKPTWDKDLMKDLGVTEFKKVRNIVSMLYQNFQVDVFLLGTSKLNTCYDFMSYNILGNLLGRIYHKFNLRYGEDGLFYVLRGFNNHVSKEIIVSRDMYEILDFIGLSHERWLEGFNDLEEIFDYVISSKYFCSDSYDLKYYNVQKRAKERPDFNKFLDYIHQMNLVKNYPFVKEKEIYLPMLDEYFGTRLKDKYEGHLRTQEKLKIVAEKFNGKIVMDTLGFTDGKTVGNFINLFKSFYGSRFVTMICNKDQNEVIELIKDFDKNYFFAK